MIKKRFSLCLCVSVVNKNNFCDNLSSLGMHTDISDCYGLERYAFPGWSLGTNLCHIFIVRADIKY